ncbi:acetyltransferase (GNAT) domain-containing protein [Ditylenchus destructor]|uniref:Acetyltransferase (GNAT) domain-containing protein n=1 Tax=Ditylenchus destructor TaxID=166010 RepID=A0AAD4MTX6_9BILA|nr:acetyltransferase (GNAT) domain-containing protein [Ditylenchus destructor]
MTKFPIYVLSVLVVVLWIQNLDANPVCEHCSTELTRGESCDHYNRNVDYWKARIHDDGEFLTITENDIQLGRLQYDLRPPRDRYPHLRPWLEIPWVECRNDRRGQGIGRALMEYAIETVAIKENYVDQTVKSEKIGHVGLEAKRGAENPNAFNLYTSLGFRIIEGNERSRHPRMELDLRCYESGDRNYTLPTLSKAPWKSKKKCDIL